LGIGAKLGLPELIGRTRKTEGSTEPGRVGGLFSGSRTFVKVFRHREIPHAPGRGRSRFLPELKKILKSRGQKTDK
jgi:hypothetical protein